MKNGIELIAAERQRQTEKEGYTPEHDDTHRFGEISQAAGYLAFGGAVVCDNDLEHMWPSDWEMKDYPTRVRELTVAGALIAAEIDRLQRKKG